MSIACTKGMLERSATLGAPHVPGSNTESRHGAAVDHGDRGRKRQHVAASGCKSASHGVMCVADGGQRALPATSGVREVVRADKTGCAFGSSTCDPHAKFTR